MRRHRLVSPGRQENGRRQAVPLLGSTVRVGQEVLSYNLLFIFIHAMPKQRIVSVLSPPN